MSRKLRLVIPVIIVIVVVVLKLSGVDLSSTGTDSGGTKTTARGAAAILEAFEQKRSNVDVEASGEVSRVLPDDNEGSRHQKFIVRLEGGHTVLIAHNIDLAKRVPLRKGDHVEFRGEYEYDERGGVVHWTHHDPAGRHVGGWIRHQSVTYE